MTYMIWSIRRNGEGSGWASEDYSQALRIAYNLWRERKEFNHSVSITMGEKNHRTTVMSPRELTNYFKKNITLYV